MASSRNTVVMALACCIAAWPSGRSAAAAEPSPAKPSACLVIAVAILIRLTPLVENYADPRFAVPKNLWGESGPHADA